MPTSRNGSATSSPDDGEAHGRQQLDDDEDQQQGVEHFDDGLGAQSVTDVQQLIRGNDEEDPRRDEQQHGDADIDDVLGEGKDGVLLALAPLAGARRPRRRIFAAAQ